MEKIENKKEDVVEIKKKYKKLRNCILIVVLILILLFLFRLLYTAKTMQDILINNSSIDFNGNYKITTTGVHSSERYYKDGKMYIKHSDFAGTLFYEDVLYIVDHTNKQYNKMENFALNTNSISLMNYMVIDDETINSFSKMILMAWQSRAHIGHENLNGKEYLTLELKSFMQKFWINTETNLVEKESNDGQIVEIKLEENVVTDEDILLPWEMGYTERKL